MFEVIVVCSWCVETAEWGDDAFEGHGGVVESAGRSEVGFESHSGMGSMQCRCS